MDYFFSSERKNKKQFDGGLPTEQMRDREGENRGQEGAKERELDQNQPALLLHSASNCVL